MPTRVRKLNWSPVERAVREWTAEFDSTGGRPRLLWRDSHDFLTVQAFSSNHDVADTWRLSGLEREIYLACDKAAVDVSDLVHELKYDSARITASLNRLDDAGILFFHGKALSLAIQQH